MLTRVARTLAFAGCFMLAGCGGGGSDSGGDGNTDVSNPGTNFAGVYRGRVSRFTIANRFLVIAADLTITVNDDATATANWSTSRGVLRLSGRVVGGANLIISRSDPKSPISQSNETCAVTIRINGQHEAGVINGIARFIFDCNSGNYTGAREFSAGRVSTARRFSQTMPAQQSNLILNLPVVFDPLTP